MPPELGIHAATRAQLAVAAVLAVAVLVTQSVFASDSASIVVAVGYTPNAPSVRIQTRADFLAVPIAIHSDAKDPVRRLDQIESVLRTVADRVRQHADLAMKPGVVSLSPREPSKSFSSYEASPGSAQLYVLAALKPETTVFALTKKIYQVVTSVPAPDGAKVVLGNTTLGMNDPERFRPQLLSLISKSVTDARRLIGANGFIEIEGLESPVVVMQVNEADVLLFISYRTKIQMRAS